MMHGRKNIKSTALFLNKWSTIYWIPACRLCCYITLVMRGHWRKNGTFLRNVGNQ